MAPRVRNWAQAAVMLLGMMALLATVGWLLGGVLGLVLAGAAVGLLGGTSGVPTAWVLRARGALPLAPGEVPWLFDTVRALSKRAGLRTMPRLYFQPTPVPNAFSIGEGDDAAIVVSHGLARLLDRREMIGVLAHELSHVANADTRVMRIAGTLNAVTGLMSRVGLVLVALNLPLVIAGAAQIPWLAIGLLLVAPMIGTAMQLSLSRRRELDADAGAVRLTDDPMALASALDRLERGHRSLWRMLVGLPQPNVPDTLRSHPATDARIRRLRALAERHQDRRRSRRPCSRRSSGPLRSPSRLRSSSAGSASLP